MLNSPECGRVKTELHPRAGVPDGWQVHHKFPLDDSGTNDFSNLVLIKNDPYHKVITNYQKAATKGVSVGSSNYIKWPIIEGTIYPLIK